jgi:hypothetical protein
MPIKEKHTSFPAFDLSEYVSDVDDADDDASISTKYQTKEDQDVAVFMAIAERLSMQSLLHLLQGHVRAMVNVMEEPVARMTRHNVHIVKKRFCFAEESNADVHCQVFEIESIKDEVELWWTDDEMGKMRKKAIDTVKHFRKLKQKYSQAIEIIATDPVEEDTKKQKHKVEQSMKLLTKESYARGLETHIVPLLGQLRTESVGAVLDEQDKFSKAPYDESSEAIAAVSAAYSQLSRMFAEKLGACDHVEALKSIMGKWTRTEE